MKPIIHKYILPLCFVVLYAVLLVPLLLSDKANLFNPEIPTFRRFNALYAIPLGVALYVGATVIHLIAGYCLFPQSADRQLLTARLAWIILFLVGCSEEIVRWMVVKVFVHVQGGGGNFGGTGSLTLGKSHASFSSQSTEVKSGIWEGIYLMCWTWSLLEVPAVWWRLRPKSSDPPHEEVVDSDHHANRSRKHLKRRSLEGVDQYTGHRGSSVIRNTDCDHKRFSSSTAVSQSNGEMGSLSILDGLETNGQAKAFQTTSLTPSSTSTPGEPLAVDLGETSDNISTSYFVDRNSNTSSYSARSPQANIRNPADFDEDSDRTPTQLYHRPHRRHDHFLGNANTLPRSRLVLPHRHSTYSMLSRQLQKPKRRESYHGFSYIDSSSDVDSPGASHRGSVNPSHTTTPLLSASIPIENVQFTSYFDYQPLGVPPQTNTPNESSSLLANTRRLPSYQDIRPGLASRASFTSIQTGDEAEDEMEYNNPPKLYPLYPTYSSSYNHLHFPASPDTAKTIMPSKTRSVTRQTRPKAVTVPSSRTIRSSKSFRKPRSPKHQQHQQHQQPLNIDIEAQPLSLDDVESVSTSAILPIVWQAISAMRHIGHGLWYAFFPAILYAGHVQWWSLGLLVVMSVMRGVFYAEWTLGKISTRELQWPTTLLCLLWTFLLYLVILIIWGALW